MTADLAIAEAAQTAVLAAQAERDTAYVAVEAGLAEIQRLRAAAAELSKAHSEVFARMTDRLARAENERDILRTEARAHAAKRAFDGAVGAGL